MVECSGQGAWVVSTESEPISVGTGVMAETLVVTAVGPLEAVDILFTGPSAAPNDWFEASRALEIRVYARFGDQKTQVHESLLENALLTPADAAGAKNAHIASFRGLLADAVEVTIAQAGSRLTALSSGVFTLRTARGTAALNALAKSATGTRLPDPRRGQGSPAAQADRWPVFLTDGTNERGSSTSPLHVQATAANLQATVSQATAANLQATVSQATAANLQATVSQATAANLQATVSQATAANLQATAAQGVAAAITAPWPVRLSDGSAAFGTATNAIHVQQATATNLQATVSQATAANLKATVTQGAAAGHASAWQVLLSDGSATLGTSTNAVTIRGRDQVATYSVGCGNVSTGTALVTGKSIAYLWHPSGNTRRIEVRRVVLSYGGGAGTGYVLLRMRRCTADVTGGTQKYGAQLDQADPAYSTSPGAFVRFGHTTNPAGDATDLVSVLAAGAATDVYTWEALQAGKPIVLRGGQAEGLEVLLDVKGTALTTAMQVAVTIDWLEF